MRQHCQTVGNPLKSELPSGCSDTVMAENGTQVW